MFSVRHSRKRNLERQIKTVRQAAGKQPKAKPPRPRDHEENKNIFFLSGLCGLRGSAFEDWAYGRGAKPLLRQHSCRN
jgi:hypothetical protein